MLDKEVVMLGLINRVLVKIQRKAQGIPRGAAHLYDSLATKYLEPSYNYIIQDILEENADKRVVLEIGCGTGVLLSEIAESINPIVLLGLDISPAMIKISKKNLVKNDKYSKIDLLLADAHKIPLRPRSVDLIVSTGTLHHIRDPETLFKEITIVLGNRGEAWIYEFSHDISIRELKESSKKLGRPRIFIKLAAAMHGLPRREYEKGYILEALIKAKASYKLRYNGVISILKLSRRFDS